jgi:RHS repeat-associated protein
MGADFGLNGWAPSQFHHLDVSSMQVELGDGGIQRGSIVKNTAQSRARFQFESIYTDDIKGVSFEPNGTFWAVKATSKVYHYSGDGKTILEIVTIPYLQDGLMHILVEPSGDVLVTSVYQIYRIHKDRTISTMLSPDCPNIDYGRPVSTGDGGPALRACIAQPSGIAEGNDGVIFVSEQSKIRRIAKDSMISTYAGTGQIGFSGDGGPATSAALSYPYGMVVRHDGRLVIADVGNNRLREVELDGTIQTIAGDGGDNQGYDSGDGGAAIASHLTSAPKDVIESQNGSICFSEQARVRCIDTLGIIHGVAGRIPYFCDLSYIDSLPGVATAMYFGAISDLVLDPQGQLNLVIPAIGINYNTWLAPQIVCLQGPFTNVRNIPSSDGSELWIFDVNGNHLQTLDGLTGDTIWTFQYDVNNKLNGIVNRQREQYQISRSSNSITISSPLSHGKLNTVLNLDPSGNVSNSIGPDGRMWSMTWNGDLLASFAKPDSGKTTFIYDSLGQFSRDIDQYGRGQALSGGLWKGVSNVKHKTAEGVTSYFEDSTFLEGGSKIQMGPDGRKSTFTQYNDGSTKQIDPDGTVTQTTVQPDPRFGFASPILATRTVTTPQGVSDTESWTSAVSDTSLFRFGSMTKMWKHNSQTWTTLWSPTLSQIQVTSPTGRTTTSLLDARHRVVQQSEPGLLPVSYAYDVLERLVSSTQGGRTVQYTWDDSGRVASITDPLGRTQSFRYDITGRTLVQILADGRKLQLGYDAGDRVTSVTPPGRTAHGFSYDRGGLDTLSWAPKISGNDSTPTESHYDLDRRLTVVRLPSGDSLRVAYDTVGRLSSVASIGDTTGYLYDSVSRPSILSRSGQSIAFSYDGSLPLSQAWTGAVTGAISTTWNSNFQPSSQTVAGSLIAYTYDADGVPSKVGSLSLSRDPTSGLFAGDSLGSSIHRLGRNGHGELVADTVRNGGAILALTSFTRDSLGRILTKAESMNDVQTDWRYHYDLAGRLDSVWVNDALSAWFGYDSNGVRVSGTGSSGVVVDAQDRQTAANGINYAYDENGQLVSRSGLSGSTRYHYTKYGELISVVLPNGDSIAYTLDPLGRKIARSLNGVMTNRWLWDGSLRPVAEVDSLGNLLTQYVYGTRVNVPDYLIRAGTTFRIITDHLGSVRLVVNASTGDVVSSLDYDTWGNVSSSLNPSFQPFGFAGGFRDDATGLTQFGVREYLPELGLWTRKDPIGFNGGLANLYGYVGNDPVNGYDPTGKALPALAIPVAVAGILGGGFSLFDYMINPCGGQNFLGGMNAFGTGGTAAMAGTLIAGIEMAAALQGALAGLATNLAENALNGKSPDFGDALKSTATGGFVGATVGLYAKLARLLSGYAVPSDASEGMNDVGTGIASGFSGSKKDCRCNK